MRTNRVGIGIGVAVENEFSMPIRIAPQTRRATHPCRCAMVPVVLTAAMAAGLLACTGCNIARIGGVLGTPGYEEGKLKAEFDIVAAEPGKVLVLVDQVALPGDGADFPYHISTRAVESLSANVGLDPLKLLEYDRLLRFRSQRPDYAFLQPYQVASALGADLVLVVAVGQYQLVELDRTGYYGGSLSGRSALFDSTGRRLWPENENGKLFSVGFEVETGGRQAAVERLARACVHCVTRYLYDCPKKKFRAFDDRVAFESENQEDFF